MINIKTIENARKLRGLTKYRMSQLLGMTAPSYYAILRNKSTKITTLDRIAAILKLDPKDLIV